MVVVLQHICGDHFNGIKDRLTNLIVKYNIFHQMIGIGMSNSCFIQFLK